MRNSRIPSGRPQVQPPAERSVSTEPSEGFSARSTGDRARRTASQVRKRDRARDDGSRRSSVRTVDAMAPHFGPVLAADEVTDV